MVPHKRLTSRGLLSNCDDLLTTGTSRPAKWYSGSVVAPGFIAIGSGPAGLSAAETFRSKHPHIPVRILTTDPALPYAKPPLSKDYLCGREVKLDLHSPDWFVRHDVELQRGITVNHIDLAHQEVVTAGGRRYPYWHLVLACGANPVPTAGHPAAWDKVPGFSCTIGESTLKYCGDYRLADQLVRSHTPMTI
jgi:NADPH-dependent 2,4-dienoyl-CoA reductase/sulfur reductase-like enzyme